MKKIIILSAFIFCAMNHYSERRNDSRLMEKQYNITRISLKEKFNLPARDLPSLLIQAYCEGKISGYYPLKPSEICGYHEFTAHFSVKKYQPSRNDDTFEEINCPASFCNTKNEASVEPFRLLVDLMEDKVFSRETSSQKMNIKYIRLLYVYEKHGLEVVLNGPLFLYEDVVKLNAEEYALPNPKNDAAKVSFKKFFEGRMFQGFPYSGDNPKPVKKNPNAEHDKWQH